MRFEEGMRGSQAPQRSSRSHKMEPVIPKAIPVAKQGTWIWRQVSVGVPVRRF